MTMNKKDSKNLLSKLEKIGVNFDKLGNKINPNLDSIKLQTLYQVIGSIVSENGIDDVRVQVLSEIARDYKRKLKSK